MTAVNTCTNGHKTEYNITHREVYARRNANADYTRWRCGHPMCSAPLATTEWKEEAYQ